MHVKKRLTLADAIIKASEVLHDYTETTFEKVIANALGIIAGAIGSDRVDIYRYTILNKKMRHRQIAYWKKDDSAAVDPRVEYLPPLTDLINWHEMLQQNKHINQRRSDMTDGEKSFIDLFDIQSVFISPIYAMGEYWGFVIFQDRSEERTVEEQYAGLINTAAKIVCTAIDRAKITNSMEETFSQLKQSMEMTATLNKTATLFLSRYERSFREMMAEGIRPVVDMLHIDIISIWRHFTKPDNLHMAQIYRWDRDKDNTAPPAIDFANLEYAHYGPTWGTLFAYTDVLNGPVSSIRDPIAADILKEFGASSIFATPIKMSDSLWGFVLFVDTHSEHFFYKESAEMMKVAAFLFANAVDHEEKEHTIDEEKVRARIMLDASPLCTDFWDGEFKLIDCNEAAVRLYGLKDKEEYVRRFFELSPKYQPDGQLTWDKTVENIQKTLREGELTFNWAHQMPDGSPLPTEVTLKRVHYKGDPIVVGYTRDLRSFISMENKIIQLETEADKIFYDALTGLYNRRFVDEHFQRLVKSIARMEGMLSLMMLDIDFFKKFNDTFGHSNGDVCLKMVADKLAESVERGDDFVARYGGEEFLVVLPNTSEKGALCIAEKMLTGIRELQIPVDDGMTNVRISIGVVSGFAQPELGAVDYINMADKCLYASKQNGRDRITFERF